jgi:hypothetical protein
VDEVHPWGPSSPLGTNQNVKNCPQGIFVLFYRYSIKTVIAAKLNYINYITYFTKITARQKIILFYQAVSATKILPRCQRDKKYCIILPRCQCNKKYCIILPRCQRVKNFLYYFTKMTVRQKNIVLFYQDVSATKIIVLYY